MITALLATAAVCLSHNYGSAQHPNVYNVTTPDGTCSQVREVIHQNKRNGYIYARPTHGWKFVRYVPDLDRPYRATGIYERNGAFLTVIAEYAERG